MRDDTSQTTPSALIGTDAIALLRKAGFVVLAEADVRAFATETIHNIRGAVEEARMAERRAAEHLDILLDGEEAGNEG
jgi:hypothetical protein